MDFVDTPELRAARRKSLAEIVAPLASDGDDVSDEEYIAHRTLALEWLTDDLARTYIRSNNTFAGRSALRIQQRYVLALLYYATKGNSWYDKVNFLSHDDECSWNDKRIIPASERLALDVGGGGSTDRAASSTALGAARLQKMNGSARSDSTLTI